MDIALYVRSAKTYITKSTNKKNKVKLAKLDKQRYEKNKAAHKTSSRDYYLRHHEEIKSKVRVYALNNNEKVRHAKRIRDRYRRKTDPTYKLRHNISYAVWRSLTNNSTSKADKSWENLFGYTKEELMKHLETQFIDNMHWNNYGRGGWVVDHIKPVCSFKITSVHCPEFKECWALDNLRPLWENENIKKAAQDKKLSVRNRK